MKKNFFNSITPPLVSVLIPCYNRPEGLDAALKDFTAQSYKNIEIIIADNCSPRKNEIQRVVAKYSHDERIRYLRHKTNIGQVRNILFVTDEAKGELVTFGSDDDRWHEDYIFELFTLLKKNPDASCAFCDYDVIDDEGNIRPEFPAPYPFLQKLDDPDRVSRLKKYILEKEAYSNKSCPQRSLIRTALFREFYHKLYDFGLMENWGDMLIIFAYLIHGRMVTSPKKLHKFTAGNPKDYFRPKPNPFYYLEGYFMFMQNYLPQDEYEILSECVGLKLEQMDCQFGGKSLPEAIDNISKLYQLSESVVDVQDIVNLNDFLQEKDYCNVIKTITKIYRRFSPEIILHLLNTTKA